jgi:hypothetical protein
VRSGKSRRSENLSETISPRRKLSRCVEEALRGRSHLRRAATSRDESDSEAQ